MITFLKRNWVLVEIYTLKPIETTWDWLRPAAPCSKLWHFTPCAKLACVLEEEQEEKQEEKEEQEQEQEEEGEEEQEKQGPAQGHSPPAITVSRGAPW